MLFGGKNRPRPPDTPSFRLEAAANLNGHVYEIAQGWEPDGAIPPGAIIRGWAIGPDGRATGDFVDNPSYDPALRPPTST